MPPSSAIFLPDTPNTSVSLPRYTSPALSSTSVVSTSSSPTLSYASSTASGEKEERQKERDIEAETYSSAEDENMNKQKGHQGHSRRRSRPRSLSLPLPGFLLSRRTNNVRPSLLILIAVLLLFALGWLFVPDARSRVVSRIRHTNVEWEGMREPEGERERDVWEVDDDGEEYSDWVKGPATYNYTDNLREDVQYITGWIGSAGWTNDVFTLVHLLQLALLAQRIPVLPPFAPFAGHMSVDDGFLAFGEIFDIPRLEKSLHTPVLEWRDVKSPASELVEGLGCWSVWMISGGQDEGYMGSAVPRDSPVPAQLGLDISYTPVPAETKMYGGGDYHVNIHRLLSLSFPTGRNAALANAKTVPSPVLQETLTPSDHMICFDYLYYVGVETSFEWEKDWSVQWRLVGRHLRWRKEVEALAARSLRKLFGGKGGFQGANVAPYIAVHARRQDFRQYCAENSRVCLASHAQIRTRVKEMQAALKEKKGIVTESVLVTSDETNLDWWKGIRDMGYTPADHRMLDTANTYGSWYEPILDSVFHSLAVAFVGTDGSTMSLIAEKRVQDWNGGPTTRLKWGQQYVKQGVPDPSL